jgi:hypothetical protein
LGHINIRCDKRGENRDLKIRIMYDNLIIEIDIICPVVEGDNRVSVGVGNVLSPVKANPIGQSDVLPAGACQLDSSVEMTL